MKSRLFLFVAAMLALLLVACGGSRQMAKVTSESPCPDWFTNVPEDPDYLYAAATASSRDLQLAINKAKQQGRVDIATQMETRLQGLTKQFKEEVGEGEDARIDAVFAEVSKTVVSTTLSGCKAKFQTTTREGPIWRACVLMEYPIGEANARFLQALKEREIVRQKAAATEAFKELEEEVKRYEQEKERKAQGLQQP